MIKRLVHLRFRLALAAVIFMLLVSSNAHDSNPDRESPFAPASLDAADSVMVTLSLDEKIAQCFVLSNPNSEDLTGSNPGGFIFDDLEAIQTFNAQFSQPKVQPLIGLSRLFESHQALDLMISVDQLATEHKPEVIKNYATALGNYFRSSGCDFVLGPSLNIYYSDQSPIGDYALGDDADLVAELSQTLIDGLKSSGLIMVAGDFPGIGNTSRGFEYAPPTVYSKRSAFYRKDMVPFKNLINGGLQSVMMANAFVPGLDSSMNIMASTSSVIHRVLREELGFNGLIWSDVSKLQFKDDFDQNPVTQTYLAGSDLIIVQNDLDRHIQNVKTQIDLGALTLEDIDKKCKRIIQSKIWLKEKSVHPDKREDRAYRLQLRARQAYSDGLTMLVNQYDAIPLRELDTSNIALLKIGTENNQLEELIMRYSGAAVYTISQSTLEADLQSYLSDQERYNLTIIIAEGSEELDRKRYGMSAALERTIQRISNTQRTILVWNGPDRALQYVLPTQKLTALIAGHEYNEWSDDLAIQAVFGGRNVNGRLRTNLSESFQKGAGLSSGKNRLSYGLPEEIGLASHDLEPINTIALKGIDEMAYPGCQVWFAKDSMVVVNRSYGHHTYENERAVRNTDLYDLASITKVAGSVAALMKLAEEGKINLDYRLCDYLGEWVDSTEYMQLTLREILAHQAGLAAWIPFYSQTLTKGVPRYDIYSLAQSETYPLQVAREFYIKSDYPDEMYRQILSQELSKEKKYKYSDVGYYFMLKIIESITETSMENYLDSVYYHPLGVPTMGYRPLDRFDKSVIAPTEYDRNFRKQLIHGYVHDPGAAMLGGVGGHAGLFSNANDLGVMMQMYLNGGSYGGDQYFNPETISAFTACQFCENDNRRGAGFDKPLREGTGGPSCGCTSVEAFGHQGFTGTVTWADPDENVVYVFLSNRVYPNADNKKLLELNIRTDIQNQFYQAIKKSKELASE